MALPAKPPATPPTTAPATLCEASPPISAPPPAHNAVPVSCEWPLQASADAPIVPAISAKALTAAILAKCFISTSWALKGLLQTKPYQTEFVPVCDLPERWRKSGGLHGA